MNTPRSRPTETPARRPPWWSWLLVSVLLILGTVATVFGGPYLDTVRDVYWAGRIASGTEWPLVGPEIGFFVHLGPVWFYLLAPALLIGPSYTSAAAWTGFLAGLKYPLALWLGVRLGNWRIGLALALILALPGVGLFTHLTFTHFSLVETTVLAFLLTALAWWRRPGYLLSLAAGVTFGLMLHAHPTTVAYGWLLPAAFARLGSRAIGHLALAGLGAGLLFVPPLLAASAEPAAGLQSIRDYISGNVHWTGTLDAPRMLWQTLIAAPRAGAGMVAGDSTWIAVFMLLPLAVLMLLGVAGIVAGLAGGRRRGLILFGLLGALAFTAQVGVMRPDTWWYMMLAALPLVGLAWAAGLAALPRLAFTGLALPLAAFGALAGMVLLTAMMVRTAADSTPRDFPIHVLMDLKTPQRAREAERIPLLSFAAADRLAAFLCRLDGPATLHGALAFQVDTLAGTMTDRVCRHQPEVRLLGMPAPDSRSILGLDRGLAGEAGLDAEKVIGALALVEPARILYPRQGLAVASARDYLPRQWTPAEPEPFTLLFELPVNEWLVISRPFYWWAETEFLAVTANGRPAQRLAGDSITEVHACADCPAEGMVTWQIHFRAPAELPPDLATIRAAGPP